MEKPKFEHEHEHEFDPSLISNLQSLICIPTHTSANGRTGDPVAPTNFSGAQTKVNAY